MAYKLDVKYVHYYTDGSTARKLLPSLPRVKPALPANKRKKRIKIFVDPVAILGIIVAVSMLISMGAGVLRLRKAHNETVQMQQYVEQLTKANADLRLEYENSYDLAEVEQAAMEMGMIPLEDAPRVTIYVHVPEVTQQVTLWEQIGTFLTGLFA